MQKAPIAAGTSSIPFAAPAVGAICAVFEEAGSLVAVPILPAVIPVVAWVAIEAVVFVGLWPEWDGEPNEEANDSDC